MISKFINSMRKNLDSKDESVILNWLLFSNDLSKGLESSLIIQLIDTMDALDFVKSNFSDETYQSTLRFQCLPNEIINAAICLNNGLSFDDVENFASNGYIECGYMPTDRHATAIFSLVEITGPENNVVLFADMKTEHIISTLISARNDASVKGINLENALIQSGLGNNKIFIYDNEDVKNALIKASETSTAFKEKITYSPVDNKIEIKAIEFESENEMQGSEQSM